MNQIEKELLLKDLCARLPYGVICWYNCVVPAWKIFIEKANAKDELKGIVPTWDGQIGYMVGIDKINALSGDIKPYLRPMSSMTEEEIREYKRLNDALDENYEVHIDNAYSAFDWLNSHHFDYRGLIEKGLALEASEGMYKKIKSL